VVTPLSNPNRFYIKPFFEMAHPTLSDDEVRQLKDRVNKRKQDALHQRDAKRLIEEKQFKEYITSILNTLDKCDTMSLPVGTSPIVLATLTRIGLDVQKQMKTVLHGADFDEVLDRYQVSILTE
jgi:hypothetical protein